MKKIILILSILIIYLILSIYLALEDFRTIPASYWEKKIWNADSTKFIQVSRYTLGVFGGGYTEIKTKDVFILRYSESTTVVGGWNNNCITIISSENALKKDIEDPNICLEINIDVDIVKYFYQPDLELLTR